MNIIQAHIINKLAIAKSHFTDPTKRNALIKNTLLFIAAATIGMMISPAKAIGVLITKMPCLDHDNCIVTTIQEFDI